MHLPYPEARKVGAGHVGDYEDYKKAQRDAAVIADQRAKGIVTIESGNEIVTSNELGGTEGAYWAPLAPDDPDYSLEDLKCTGDQG